MNPESDFRIESTYDRQAYQAMAKATWKLFQKHRMEVMAYPALISVALVIAVLLVFNWNHTVLPIRILGIAFIVLQFAVIPLGKVEPRHIHPCADQLFNRLHIAAGRPQRRYNFGLPHRHMRLSLSRNVLQ